MHRGAPHVPRAELPPRREDALAQRAFGACVTRERLGEEVGGLRNGIWDLRQGRQQRLGCLLNMGFNGRPELHGLAGGQECRAQTEGAQLHGRFIHGVVVMTRFVQRGVISQGRVNGAHGAPTRAYVRGQGDWAPENPCGQHQCCSHNSRLHTKLTVCPSNGGVKFLTSGSRCKLGSNEFM